MTLMAADKPARSLEVETHKRRRQLEATRRRADRKLKEVESSVAKIAKTLERDTKGLIDQGSLAAGKKLSEAEALLKEARGALPTERRRARFWGWSMVSVLMISVVGAGAYAAWRMIKAMRRDRDGDLPDGQDWSSFSARPSSYGVNDPPTESQSEVTRANGGESSGRSRRSSEVTPETGQE
jgi:hypothetical protein